MDQEKIGRFIAEKRKEKKMTQEMLARELGVSINAVSKWERGICMMDISLLKPLSQLLDISVIELLSGENVASGQIEVKAEESIENLVKLNEMKSKSFGVIGMLVIYVLLILYKVANDLCFFDIVAILCGFNAFKFAYKYKLEKDLGNLIVSLISFFTCIFMLFEYVIQTL